MWAPFGAFGLLLALLSPGCERLCVRHSDCPLDYVCRPDGLCELPPAPPPVDADVEADSGTEPVPEPPDSGADADAEPGDGEPPGDATEADPPDAGDLDAF